MSQKYLCLTRRGQSTDLFRLHHGEPTQWHALTSVSPITSRCARTSTVPGIGSTFTTKYGVKMLVWYKFGTGDVDEAIAREKQLKTWAREWKLALIERFNRDWRDLYEQLNA